ncbi:cellulase [Pseudomassariella vexata]|uniref:cellulase n=1 Tax=Pseudomassariella vexata TaxID=1141098 RepID=A0A1Y2EKW9_9PEZI|nr:cellulase [Pseudomassariella vexata]ORY72171.1 cellulase [Pseudomassariella vexata]
MRSLLLISALAGPAIAQGSAWAQCGGVGWTGATTCVSGYTCVKSNEYYSQCLPSTATTTAASTLKTSTKASTSTNAATTTTASTVKATTATATATAPAASGSGNGTGLTWLGVNESGGEFGQGSIPGAYGTDFIFPSDSTIDTLVAEGYNIFRVPFLMERMAPSGLTGTFSAAYLANYTASIEYITSAGAYAVLDPHNFGRYNGAIMNDTAGFQTFWKTLATAFADNAKVIFDTNNEYHDEDQTVVLNMNQAAIDGIRAAGATSQYIFVEGNSYSGAWTWTTVNTNLAALTDTEDKIVYEMHQYLDSDGSGTSDVCVSSTIGAERISDATAWLQANGKKGIIGEFAGGANTQCKSAIVGMLDQLKANSDVWMGAMWWGGGPWWGDYIYSFEPPSGVAYSYYDSVLKGYAP